MENDKMIKVWNWPIILFLLCLCFYFPVVTSSVSNIIMTNQYKNLHVFFILLLFIWLTNLVFQKGGFSFYKKVLFSKNRQLYVISFFTQALKYHLIDSMELLFFQKKNWDTIQLSSCFSPYVLHYNYTKLSCITRIV